MPLANFFGGDPVNRGGIRVSATDLDGDKKADIVVGAGDGNPALVTAYPASGLNLQSAPTPSLQFNAFPDGLNGVFVG